MTEYNKNKYNNIKTFLKKQEQIAGQELYHGQTASAVDNVPQVFQCDTTEGVHIVWNEKGVQNPFH